MTTTAPRANETPIRFRIDQHSPCTGCGRHRRKRERWHWVWPDLGTFGSGLYEPIAVYCRPCAEECGINFRGERP